MIDPTTINPLELPSVPLLDRKKLYRWGGVYFIVKDEQDILYIGQSSLTKDRFNQHQCFGFLSVEYQQKSRIYWLAANENLEHIEAVFLHRFHPQFNRIYLSLEPKVESVKSTCLKVRRVVETVQDFPGLGEKIRSVRQQDKRSLSSICKQCGISRAYWYQIENEDLRSPVT